MNFILYFLLVVFKEMLRFLVMDFVFVISVNFENVDVIFKLMKDSIKKIMYELGYVNGNV